MEETEKPVKKPRTPRKKRGMYGDKEKLDKAIKLAFDVLEQTPENNDIRNLNNPDRHNGNNSFTGCVNTDCEVKQSPIWWACHAKIASWTKPYVYFSKMCHIFPANKGAKASRAWYKFILDPEKSPWRALLKIINEDPRKCDGIDVTSFRYRTRKGFIIWNLDRIPANLLASFMIASRLPRQWPDFTKRWYKFVQNGVDPAFAYVFTLMSSSAVNKPKNSIINLYYSNHSDVSFDHVTAIQEHLFNFKDGVLITEQLLAPYSVRQQYTPVNVIFGRESQIYDYGNRKLGYTYDLFNRYYEKFGTVGKDSWTGQKIADPSYWRFTEAEWEQITKLENERLLKEYNEKQVSS